MNKKLSIILATVAILVLVFSTMVFGQALNDLELSPYKMEIEKLVEDKIILGYPDGSFKPEDTISRVELASILTKALGLEEDQEAGRRFTDVAGQWSEGIVGAVYNEGIMIGKSQTFFGADDEITKEEMAVLLLRAFNLEEIANELKLESNFFDEDNIGNWAKNALALAYEMELIDAAKNEDETISIEAKSLLDRQIVAKLVYELIYNEEMYMEKIKAIADSQVSLGDKIKDEDLEIGDDPVTDEILSYEEILSEYRSKLSVAESKYEGLLDSLFSQAKKEYNENTGNPDFLVTELYEKYEAKARALESQADSEVDAILSELESQLNKYGYDRSIVENLRKEYEDKKDQVEAGI